LVLWITIARRLSTTGRPRLLTASIGAAPLFGLSLLGYAVAAVEFVVDLFYDDFCPVASIYIFGFLATVVLFAGLAAVTAIYYGGRRGV
jgi:hypothetical protein